MTTLYRYESLTPKHGDIRILRLHPSKDVAAPVECELFEAHLNPYEPIHPYEALSYVWGDPGNTVSIHVNQHDLQVTTNLHAALLQLRNSFIDRYFWIDAICINQADEEEKVQQIQLMYRIYSFAQRVLVWLGAEDTNSVQALEGIRVAAGRQDALRWGDAMQAAIFALLERKWFRRLWVLQEVAAARSVVIICGSVEMDGYAFASGLRNLNLKLGDGSGLHDLVRPLAFLLRGATFRSRDPTRLTIGHASLGELIDMYHTREASRQHDKIFALLSMSSEEKEATKHFVDYGKPWKEVLELVIRFLIPSLTFVKTYDGATTAVISARGHVFGHIVSIERHHDQYDMQRLTVRLTNTPYTFMDKADHEEDIWTIRAIAKSVQKDDMICLFEGSLKPSIIRRHKDKDYFTIVAIATPRVLDGLRDGRLDNCLSLQASRLRSLVLVWNLDSAPIHGRSFHEKDAEANTIFLHHHLHAPSDRQYLLSIALALRDAGLYDIAENYLQRVEAQAYAASSSDQMILTCLESKVYISMKRKDWEGADKAFAAVYQLNQRIYGRNDGSSVKILADHAKLCLTQDEGLRGRISVDDLVVRLGSRKPLLEEQVVHLIEASAMRSLNLLLCADACITQVTDTMVAAAAGRRDSGRVMRLLLEKRPNEVQVTEGVVTAAAEWGDEEVIRLLLENRPNEVKVTEGALIAAARGGWGSLRIMRLLLEKRPNEVKVTEAVVTAAAGSTSTGEEAMRLLLEKTPNEVNVTEGVITAAAGNLRRGERIMHLLLEQRAEHVEITEQILITIVRTFSATIVSILLEKRPNEVKVTEGVVIAAVVNEWSGERVTRLLLMERPNEVNVTKAVVTAAAGIQDKWRREAVMRLLHRHPSYLYLNHV